MTGEAKPGTNATAGQRLRGEGGQALVEFAITLPLLTLLVLSAIWFYELVHVKLKIQEAARYAAWETTAFKLHDYDQGGASTLPIPAVDLPQVDLGSLGVNLPYGLEGMASKELNKQLQNQLGQLIPYGGFGLAAQAVATVSLETMARFTDMNSATLAPGGQGMLSSSWDMPLVFGVDQMEEPVYGGPLANLLVGVGGALFDIISSLSVTDTNWVAQALLASGKNMGSARAFRTFGAPEWGFNRRGYIQTYAAVRLRNDWVPGLEVTISERYGLLADSWRLNSGGASYGDKDEPGYAPNSPLWKQVDRMYLVSRRTRGVFESVALKPFWALMQTALTAIFVENTSAPTIERLARTSVVSKAYRDATSGKVSITQDTGPQPYDTAPLRGQYKETLAERGEWFMGCKQPMQLGCTSTLAQDNPFGDYIVRE